MVNHWLGRMKRDGVTRAFQLLDVVKTGSYVGKISCPLLGGWFCRNAGSFRLFSDEESSEESCSTYWKLICRTKIVNIHP